MSLKLERDGLVIILILFLVVVVGCATGRQARVYEKAYKIPKAIEEGEEVEFTITWLRKKRAVEGMQLDILRERRGIEIIDEVKLRTVVGKTGELQTMMEIPYIQKITLQDTLGATSVEVERARVGNMITIGSKALADGSVKVELTFELRRFVERISIYPNIPECLGVPALNIVKGQTSAIIRDGDSLSLGGVTVESPKRGSNLLFLTLESLGERNDFLAPDSIKSNSGS